MNPTATATATDCTCWRWVVALVLVVPVALAPTLLTRHAAPARSAGAAMVASAAIGR